MMVDDDDDHHCIPPPPQLWDSGPMAAGYALSGNRCHFFTNDSFATTFMTQEELAAKHLQHRVIPPLLWSW